MEDFGRQLGCLISGLVWTVAVLVMIVCILIALLAGRW
jgi:hypothetical protein